MTVKTTLVCDFPFHPCEGEPAVCWEIHNIRTGLVNNDEVDCKGGRDVRHACSHCGSTIRIVLDKLEIKHNVVDVQHRPYPALGKITTGA